MIEKSETLEKLGNNVIKRNKEFRFIIDFGIRIAFLISDKEKKANKKIVLGDCKKVKDEYSWVCPYDFMITFYEPNIIGLNDKQLRILMKHELKHIGLEAGGKEPRFYIVPHDIEDFRDILKKYGMDWNGVK